MKNDKFRILISTDNHLGYFEKDGVRSNDSFKSFEEVIFIAEKEDVDFVLLAGDLFHENRPSINTIHECTSILRKYVYGKKNHKFEILSHPDDNYATSQFKITNFLDENIAVKIPIFSIHGNHDDPLGPSCLCALDILHSAGLLNLFGKHSSTESITVKPILMRKGNTKLAIYGLSAIREERMYRMFANNLIKFDRPHDSEDYFNIILVHQNRAKHGPTNHLPEHFIPDFFDLVIWGHEHECRIIPEYNAQQNFYVCQPGSSVATSLSEGEAVPKAVGILEIVDKEFKEIVADSEPSLKADAFSPDSGDKLQLFCARLVDKIIKACFENTAAAMDENKSQVSPVAKRGFSRLPSIEPLIRIKVDISNGFESFSSFRFSQSYVGRVANLKDIVTFNKKKEKAEENAIKRMKASNDLISDDLQKSYANVVMTSSQISMSKTDVLVILESYLDRYSEVKDRSVPEKGMLSCLTLNEMKIALSHFVDKENNDAINFIVEKVVNFVNSRLRKTQCPEERIQQSIWLNHLERYASEKDSSRFDLASLSEFIKLNENDEKNIRRISDTQPEDEPIKKKIDTMIFSDSEDEKPSELIKNQVKPDQLSGRSKNLFLKRSVLSFDDDDEDQKDTTDRNFNDESILNSLSCASQSKTKRARASRSTTSSRTGSTRKILSLEDDDDEEKDDFGINQTMITTSSGRTRREILTIDESEDEDFIPSSASQRSCRGSSRGSRRGRSASTASTRGSTSRGRRRASSKSIIDFI